MIHSNQIALSPEQSIASGGNMACVNERFQISNGMGLTMDETETVVPINWLRKSGLVLSVFCVLLLLPATARSQVVDVSPTVGSSLLDSLAAVQEQQSALEDSRIANRLHFLFEGFEPFREIDVVVRGQVVVLTGRVLDPSDRAEAASIATALPGVLHVVNDIETTLAVDARVAPALQRARDYLKDAIAYLPVIAVALVVLILFWLMSVTVGRIRTPFAKLGMTPLVSNLMARLLRFLIFVIGVILALDILGITALVGAVLGTAGLVGIAIGFAFQDIIENYLSGLILSVRHPFSAGDHVRVSGEEGKVVRLTSRELMLMTLDGNHLSIPNAQVFKSTLLNYTRNPKRRFQFDVGIDVGEDLQRVQAIGVGTMESLQGIMQDPGPVMRIKDIGDSNIVVSYFGWVDQTLADFGKVRSETIRLVKVSLDEAGVLMPEPIYNVRMQEIQAPARLVEPDPASRMGTSAKTTIEEVDVSPETEIDKQIQEDLARSDEPNLLKPS